MLLHINFLQESVVEQGNCVLSELSLFFCVIVSTVLHSTRFDSFLSLLSYICVMLALTCNLLLHFDGFIPSSALSHYLYPVWRYFFVMETKENAELQPNASLYSYCTIMQWWCILSLHLLCWDEASTIGLSCFRLNWYVF